MMRRTLFFFFVAFVTSQVATADPIKYIYEGVGSGDIGNMFFQDANFVIEAFADTDNITSWPSGADGPQNTHLMTTLQIDGIGLVTINTPSHSWMSGDPDLFLSGGLGADLGANWISFSEDALDNYGLDTAIGPVLETDPQNVNQFANVDTSLGQLNLQSISQVTFTAVIVPEPSSMALIAAGMFAWLGRRSRTANWCLADPASKTSID